MAADKGDAEAQYEYASVRLQLGEQNDDDGMRYLRLAAAQRHVPALMLLAEHSPLEERHSALQTAVELGSVEATCALAACHYQMHRFAEARALMAGLPALDEYQQTRFHYAQLLLWGRGGPPDLRRAEEIFNELHQRGYRRTTAELGKMSLFGQAEAVDPETSASELFTMVCRLDDTGGGYHAEGQHTRVYQALVLIKYGERYEVALRLLNATMNHLLPMEHAMVNALQNRLGHQPVPWPECASIIPAQQLVFAWLAHVFDDAEPEARYLTPASEGECFDQILVELGGSLVSFVREWPALRRRVSTLRACVDALDDSVCSSSGPRLQAPKTCWNGRSRPTACTRCWRTSSPERNTDKSAHRAMGLRKLLNVEILFMQDGDLPTERPRAERLVPALHLFVVALCLVSMVFNVYEVLVGAKDEDDTPAASCKDSPPGTSPCA